MTAWGQAKKCEAMLAWASNAPIRRPPWGHQAVCLQRLYRHGPMSQSQHTRLKPSVSSHIENTRSVEETRRRGKDCTFSYALGNLWAQATPSSAKERQICKCPALPMCKEKRTTLTCLRLRAYAAPHSFSIYQCPSITISIIWALPHGVFHVHNLIRQ